MPHICRDEFIKQSYQTKKEHGEVTLTNFKIDVPLKNFYIFSKGTT